MRITDHELQTRTGQLWLDIQERLAAKDALLAAKDAEIATLQPGYVAPAPPCLADRILDAIDAVLTADEKRDHRATLERLTADFATVEEVSEIRRG